jgi:hydrogenase expression/formation protein HypC
MCLGIPALVKERSGDIGKVDFGGTAREVNLSLVDAKVGEYVIVHAGFAIQVMEEKHALETLELFRDVYGEQLGLPEQETGPADASGKKKAIRKKGGGHA